MRLDKLPWATIMLGLLVAIVAVGGLLAMLLGDALSFEEYARVLGEFAIAVGLLGVGRGILKSRTRD